MGYVIRKMQEAIDIVIEWGYNWGFKFSIEKTQSVFFTRKGVQKGLKLRMYGRDLEKVRNFTFLGINLDSRLTFADHVHICGSNRSVLDYGCVVFGCAAQSQLKKLDVIQAQALRLCCGAFKTTPVSALQVEMGEFPLELRMKQLMVNYWAGLHGHNNSHHTKEMLQDSWENGKRLSENKG